MISLSELEEQLDLTKYERNLGNKRTRAAKYFWMAVLILYDEKLRQKKAFDVDDWGLICKAYTNIFYKPLELSIGILEHYEGISTSKMKALKFNSSIEIFNSQLWIQRVELEKQIRNLLKKNDVDFSMLDPAKADFFDIYFLDHRHPHLPTISYYYKKILDAGNYTITMDNKFLADKDILKLLKPSMVKKNLNDVMDKITRFRYMVKSCEFLYKRLNLPSDTFHVKYKKAGPKAALDHFCYHNPELVSLSDKELKYYIEKQYCRLNGEAFLKDSIQNAIKVLRDE